MEEGGLDISVTCSVCDMWVQMSTCVSRREGGEDNGDLHANSTKAVDI